MLYVSIAKCKPINLPYDCECKISGTGCLKAREILNFYQFSLWKIGQLVTFKRLFEKMLVFNEICSEKKKNWFTFGTWVYYLHHMVKGAQFHSRLYLIYVRVVFLWKKIVQWNQLLYLLFGLLGNKRRHRGLVRGAWSLDTFFMRHSHHYVYCVNLYGMCYNR